MKTTKILALVLLLSLLLCGCGIRRIGSTSDSSDSRQSDMPTATAPEQTDTQTDSPAQTDAQRGDPDTAVTPPVTEPQTDAPAVNAPKGEYKPLTFMYHLILEEPYSQYEGLFVRPSEFRAHLGVLNSLGYRYAFADEYVEQAEYPTAILTFDDGYEDNYTEMFPLLKEANAKATIFLAKTLVGKPGYLTEAQIKEMAASGLVRFESHTVSHVEIGNQSAEFIEREMTQSIEYIEGLTGCPVRALAYPAGSFSEATMTEVGKYVDFAYTTEPPSRASVDSVLAIPRIRISRGCSEGAFRGICEY